MAVAGRIQPHPGTAAPFILADLPPHEATAKTAPAGCALTEEEDDGCGVKGKPGIHVDEKPWIFSLYTDDAHAEAVQSD